VEVAPVEGVEVGPLDAPSPSLFQVAGLHEQFVVYDGLVRLTVPLTFPTATGDVTIEAAVRYQACSATECLLPGTLRRRLPVTRLNHVERPN
jgi:DsbC/DsbD-like thiol-disulfide interchange protein